MVTRAHWCWMHKTARKLTHDTDVWEANKFKAPFPNGLAFDWIQSRKIALLFTQCMQINFFDADLKAIMVCNVEQTTGFIMLFFMQFSSVLKKTTMMMMMHTYLTSKGEEVGKKELYAHTFFSMLCYSTTEANLIWIKLNCTNKMAESLIFSRIFQVNHYYLVLTVIYYSIFFFY